MKKLLEKCDGGRRGDNSAQEKSLGLMNREELSGEGRSLREPVRKVPKRRRGEVGQGRSYRERSPKLLPMRGKQRVLGGISD